MDFTAKQGQVTFDVGNHNTSLEISLTPDRASSLPTPKRFQVELYSPSGGATVHSQFGLANVTLVSNAASEAVWVLLDQLHQPLDPPILNQVLQEMVNKVSPPLTSEQLIAVLDGLGKVSLIICVAPNIFLMLQKCIKHCIVRVVARDCESV